MIPPRILLRISTRQFPAATLLALTLLAGVVQAQVTNVIYQDTFARSGLLSGSMPDTATATVAKYIAGPLVYTGTWTDQNGNTENERASDIYGAGGVRG